MRLNAPRIMHAVTVLVFVVKFPIILPSQTATLSGTATGAKGNAIANAAVSLKPETGSAIEVHTDNEGNYSIPNLTPGDYTISASAEGLSSRQIKVTITTSPHQTLDLLLTPMQAEPTPSTGSPNAPSPSLEDLGFSTQQTQGNAQLQSMLEKRTRMLKTHQRL